MNSKSTISSDDQIRSIESPFRVQAGPGAGKTYWLVRHIRRVIRESDRLGAGEKIACISYTNVAVEELKEDLYQVGVRGTEVDVSTIHSFLYRNVVRPYLFLLKDDDGNCIANHTEVDGHREHRTSYPKMKDWVDSTDKDARISDTDIWARRLETFWWEYEDGEWKPKVRPPRDDNDVDQYVPTTQLEKYKPIFWQEGIIHHEDVLYFAHRLLSEFPELRGFLSAKYPYLFIDEFQDTGPTQAEVVKWLAAGNTTVGVIGDVEQSIYGFRGARPDELSEFGLPDIQDYEISNNRRSTKEIVSFLNSVRSDGLEQHPLPDADDGDPVRCLVGAPGKVAANIQERLQGEEFAVLAYENEMVESFRGREGDQVSSDNSLWKRFSEEDSNRDRVEFIRQSLRGLSLAQRNKMGLAIRETKKGVRLRDGELKDPFRSDREISKLERRGIAMTVVTFWAGELGTLTEISLKRAYNQLVTQIQLEFEGVSVTSYGNGDGARFADDRNIDAFLDSVSLSGGGDTRPIRTIHKAKGAEFDNVLLWFADGDEADGEEELKRVLIKEEGDDQRVYYVGMSRAKRRLFLGVPTLSAGVRRILSRKDVVIEDV
jgi:DNA helicase-2/ATP-dependent DNA helicase PcrA